jgi:hypothetical protein
MGELFVAMAEGRTPNLDEAQLAVIEGILPVAQRGIDLTRQFRADVASLVGTTVTVVEDTADDSDATGLSLGSASTPQELGTGAETNTVTVPPVDASPLAPRAENGESKDTLELSSEAQFVLSSMRGLPAGELVNKQALLNRGFKSVEPRTSDGAYDQAFVKAVNQLIAAGLIERPEKGFYVLVSPADTATSTNGDKPFLA